MIFNWRHVLQFPRGLKSQALSQTDDNSFIYLLVIYILSWPHPENWCLGVFQLIWCVCSIMLTQMHVDATRSSRESMRVQMYTVDLVTGMPCFVICLCIKGIFKLSDYKTKDFWIVGLRSTRYHIYWINLNKPSVWFTSLQMLTLLSKECWDFYSIVMPPIIEYCNNVKQIMCVDF